MILEERVIKMRRHWLYTQVEIPKHGWPTNEAPIEYMIDFLSKGKSAEEQSQVELDFKESHTYLLICEYGKGSPRGMVLKRIYQAEQEDGLVGFVNALTDEIPSFFL